MRKESGFVPIDEANTDRVRFAVDLPSYVDRTQIRANPGRIESFMRIGGISHLRVETFEGERIQDSPAIVGFDSQGNAYAGRVGARTKTEEFNIDSSKDGKKGIPTASLTVKFDVAQINQGIVDEGVRSPSAWAKKLDRGILEGVRNSGSRVLLIENIKYDLLQMGVQSYLVSNSLVRGTLLGIAINVTILPLFTNTIGLVLGHNNRFSLVFGPQLDRAALLQARSRLQKVVKAS